MKIIKWLASAAFAIILAFFLVANFSSVETRFKCSSRTPPDRALQQSGEIFMKLHEYRWWVSLWSDSDGSVWLEIPNKSFEYYGHIVEVADQLQFYESPKGLSRGYFSKLSKSLNVLAPNFSFEGSCVQIDK